MLKKKEPKPVYLIDFTRKEIEALYTLLYVDLNLQFSGALSKAAVKIGVEQLKITHGRKVK